MISIILYGRNDNYGYNLHKRAALSFNCMAEVLEQGDDEILFVDYNTPNDFPTFPEAIQDTLTEKARQRLRILRVRPHIHQRFSSKTRLLALEPISRNVAIRRSNPNNRWILSTNTDMIFVPQRAGSLDEIVANLPSGFYHAPRIEIPETLWEGLDRTKAREAIETVRDWGRSLHINEIVLGAPFILYDGPGDFQLMQRSDLFQIHGFHEGMLLGWHVDSNIAARLTLIHGRVGDLGDGVYGYHCDHTRQITPAHSHLRTENDWRTFVDGVERPDVPEQADSWGCASDNIEEIRFGKDSSSVYISALKEQVGGRLLVPPVVTYTGKSFNQTDYDPRHLLPFLADLFVCSERGTNVAWLGGRSETLRLFAGIWRRLGFTGKILVSDAEVRDQGFVYVAEATRVDLKTLLVDADAFVIDFGRPLGEEGLADFGGLQMPLARALNRSLLHVVQAEYNRLNWGNSPRQIIAINAINNVFEGIVMAYIGVGLTPYSTRMRHGFVLPEPKGVTDWTLGLQVGAVGIRDGSIVRSREEAIGSIAYGPYRHVFTGHYRLVLKVSGEARKDARPDEPVAVLEIASQHSYIAHRLVIPADLARGEIEIKIDVSERLAFDLGFALETRLRSLEPLRIAILQLTCERLSDQTPAASEEAAVLGIGNWLPFLSIGRAGVTGNGRVSTTGRPGHLLYGPYWALPPGEYEAVFKLEADVAASQGSVSDIVCRFAAFSGEDHLGLTVLRRDDLQQQNWVRLIFVVTAERAQDPSFALELQVYDHAILPFTIEEVRVRRLGEPGAERGIDLLKLMTVGPAGGWDKGQILLQRGNRGLVAHSLGWQLRQGRYELGLELGEVVGIDSAGEALLTLMVMSRGGRLRASRSVGAAELKQSRQAITFEVREDETPQGRLPVELHILSSGAVAGVVRSIIMCRIGDSTGTSVWLEQNEMDWLPFLSIGGVGVARNGRISTTGRLGYLLYGPYWVLPPGEYEAVFKLEADVAASQGSVSDIVCSFEAFSGEDHLGLTVLRRDDLRQQNWVRLIFVVTAERAQDPSFALELRVYDHAILPFTIEEVRVRRLGEPGAERGIDLLKLMTVGPAGGWDKGQILLQRGNRGLVAHSLGWQLRQGRYELGLELGEVVGIDSAGEALLTLMVMSRGGRLRASRSVGAAELKQSRQAITFEVREDETPQGRLPVELHILSSGAVAGVVRSIIMCRIGDSTGTSVWLEQNKMDWTPWLTIGPAGNRQTRGIAARPETEGYVVYGPCWKLAPGHYQMIVHLAKGVEQNGVGGSVDIADQLGALVIAETDLDREHLRQGMVRLPFTIGPGEGMQVETRVRKLPKSSFLVTRIVVEQITHT